MCNEISRAFRPRCPQLPVHPVELTRRGHRGEGGGVAEISLETGEEAATQRRARIARADMGPYVCSRGGNR